MATVPSSSLVDTLRQYRLLEPTQLEELKNGQPGSPDPKALAKELMNRGWLTAYQVNQLFQGKAQELVLGQYVLLERLGEGGMGQVFKARHRNLNRIAAIKLIRKERLNNPDAIKRFQREVRAAAALDHPNIVRALDADEIGGTHLLVMEHIEGATDLAQLVKKNGPLPVAQACEYIRQAALGLQHAFERGMVHRDIKPANLLLTADRKTVKVLDMGLARLDPLAADDDKSSTMTHEGMVMGTPDYLSPEQAQESHTVDIRADLYSLGCSFYFVLTGRVPFPGGTLIDKLFKHRLEEPKPVECLRSDLPLGLAAVVRKLMAKKPEDRYQTPAQLTAALAEPFTSDSRASHIASANAETVVESRKSFNLAFANLATSDDTEALARPQRPARKAEQPRWLLFGVVVGSLLVISFAVLLLLFLKQLGGSKSPTNEDPPVIVRTPPKKTHPKMADAWLKQVAAMPADKQVEAVAAKLKELNDGFDGKVTPRIEEGVVTELLFVSDKVTDISPVKALTGLKSLNCSGSVAAVDSDSGKGGLLDLSPLKAMKLTSLVCNGTRISDLSALKEMRLTHIECGWTRVADLSPLKGMPLTSLRCARSQVSDLTPLQGMKLTTLWLDGTPVSDLSPIKGMPLSSLLCAATNVTDLSALKGMPLTELACGWTTIADLSPLKGMKLANISFPYARVADLSPLKGMPVTSLNYVGAQVVDLGPLKEMPIKELYCDFSPARDTDILRSIKTLEKINKKAAAAFWNEVEQRQAAYRTWLMKGATLHAEKQVEAVAAKLKEFNEGFDGKVKHRVDNGIVTSLEFLTDQVTDISPVKLLNELKTLICPGSNSGNGKLSDLLPLKGMKLTGILLDWTNVSDLSPLKGMELTGINCGGTRVLDLSPLKGMPLTYVWFPHTGVSDLSPLKGMPISSLNCGGTQVSNLSPLAGMKLVNFQCWTTKVSDLSPLKGMPLKRLHCDFRPDRDTEILRSLKTLETINGKPTEEFWRDEGAKKLQKQP
jgi:serine/threonine protein kinase/Leucine-rich repeat (LRR) protein